MSIDHLEFLSSAEKMIPGAAEIDLRNAISRAYYAAYHRALASAEYCPDNSHLVLDCGAHERTISRFLSFDNSSPLAIPAKSLAYVLRQLKTNRHRADYTLREDVMVDEVESHMTLVKKLFEKFQSFDTEATKLLPVQSMPVQQT